MATADDSTTATRKPAAKKTTSRSSSAKSGTAASGSGNRTSVGTVIGVAAAGVAAGLVANLGRKAMVQAPTALAGDWFEGLKAEHRATLALFDALEKTSEKNRIKRSTLLTQIKHALAKHALSEENAIYPALREAGEVEAADELHHEHGYVKDFLYQLDNMAKESPAFLQKVAEFRKLLEEHIRDEEDRIFPALHQRLSAAKNKTLTHAANKEGFKLA